jgi:hypothetical protein
MAVSFLGSNQQTSTGSSVGVSVTVPAGGGYLEVYVTTGGATTQFSGVADNSGNGNLYTIQSSAEDTVGTQSLARYTSNASVAAGTFTVTASFANSTQGALGIAVILVTGSTGQLAGLAANFQTTPGTGVGAVTTGSSGTLSSQPSVMVAITIGSSGGTLSTSAAGGSTQLGSTIWGALKANLGFMETQALSATTSIAATFTAGSATNNFISVGGIWQQSSGAAPPLMGQILT